MEGDRLQLLEGEKCLAEKVERIQYTKNKNNTHSRMALYHVMREQGTLVASRFWAEKGVGRANLNEHTKPDSPAPQIATGDYPDPGPTLSVRARGGGGEQD